MSNDVPWSHDELAEALLKAVPVINGKVDLTIEELEQLLVKFWWIGKEN